MNDNNPINNANNDTDIWGRKIDSNKDLTIHQKKDNEEVEQLNTPNIPGSIMGSNVGNTENEIEIPELKKESSNANTFFNEDVLNDTKNTQNSNTFFNQDTSVTKNEIKPEVSNSINTQTLDTSSFNNPSTTIKNERPKTNTFFNEDILNNTKNTQNFNTFFNQESVVPKEEVKIEVSNDINTQNADTSIPNNSSNIESSDDIFNLESKSIGTIKKDKQKSPTAMLILFGVLILTIFFIPEITPYFNDILTKLNISDNEEIYETPVKPDDSEDNETEEEIPNEDDVPEIETFPIDLATTVTFDKLSFTNLEKALIDNTYYFKYTINNTDIENKFDFSTNRIYIDFYQENTYLGRALINIESIGANSNMSLQSVINENVYNNATSIQIVNRNISDYPKSELPNAIITCEAPNRSISYTFNNGKLTNIKDIFNYIKVDDDSFTMNYLNYQTKALKLSEESIATAKVTGIDGGFTYEANINYEEDINLTSHDILYYPKDTTKDIVNYEIESLGYTCK